MTRAGRRARRLARARGVRPAPARALLAAAATLAGLAGTAPWAQAGAPGPKAGAPGEATFLETIQDVFSRLSVYGDLRLRHETNTHLVGRPTRNRERARLRLGANYEVAPGVLAGARITTGSRTDPNSPHQTFGDGAKSFELTLDRVFATLHPSWGHGVSLTAGKFAHPFWKNPVYGELVWDADVQPEGVVGEGRWDLPRPLESLQVAAGEYVLVEQALADEASAFVAQAVLHARPLEHWRVSAGAGAYRYANVTPDGSQTLVADNAGNALAGPPGAARFRSDFTILNPILAVAFDGLGVPCVASAEYIRNTDAAVAKDQGWAVGLAVGRAREAGDWRAYYQWQVVEQDAVFSPFAQDDFLLATNHRSHLFGINLQVLANVGVHLWGLVSALDRTGLAPTTAHGAFQWRVRLDVNLKL